MTDFAIVIPEGLALHRNADFSSRVVTELVRGDRVKILQKRASPGGTPMAEVMVSRTKNGIQAGQVGWARENLLKMEEPIPPPPDIPICEDAPETEPFPLGTYIAYGLLAIGVLAFLVWVFNI